MKLEVEIFEAEILALQAKLLKRRFQGSYSVGGARGLLNNRLIA